MKNKFKDLIGMRFGNLVVLNRLLSYLGYARWLCHCDCGNNKSVLGTNLIHNRTKSCGCLNKKWMSRLGKNNKTHGLTKTSTFKSWKSMLDRCNNPNLRCYQYYGKRGIKVCDRWLKFENFLEDMNQKPSSKHQIDRIDNNKGYYKENCKWSSPKQNCRNRSNNHNILFNGKTQCISAWAEELDIPSQILYRRINLDLWSIERALITPFKKYQRKKILKEFVV